MPRCGSNEDPGSTAAEDRPSGGAPAPVSEAVEHGDTKPAEQLGSSPAPGLEAALAVALERASAAGQWSVVACLAAELQARRLASAGNVVALGAARERVR